MAGTQQRVYPLSVACPKCGTAKGKPCGKVAGGVLIPALRANAAKGA